MKVEKWAGEVNQEVKYKLKDLMWYKTNQGFFPFIENLDGTKVKLLSTGKVAKLKSTLEEKQFSPVDDEPVLTVCKDYESALKKLTKLDGKVCNVYQVIHDYYFEDRRMELVRGWINATEQTIYQIKGMTSFMNNSLQREQKKVKDSRDF